MSAVAGRPSSAADWQLTVADRVRAARVPAPVPVDRLHVVGDGLRPVSDSSTDVPEHRVYVRTLMVGVVDRADVVVDRPELATDRRHVGADAGAGARGRGEAVADYVDMDADVVAVAVDRAQAVIDRSDHDGEHSAAAHAGSRGASDQPANGGRCVADGRTRPVPVDGGRPPRTERGTHLAIHDAATPAGMADAAGRSAGAPDFAFRGADPVAEVADERMCVSHSDDIVAAFRPPVAADATAVESRLLDASDRHLAVSPRDSPSGAARKDQWQALLLLLYTQSSSKIPT